MVVYGFAVAFSKIAILLLYVRVFTTRNRMFTILSYLMGFVITATCLVNAFMAIFQCTPVRRAWDTSVTEGSCIDNLAFERYTAIPNVVTGAIMLAMPMPLIWELNIAVAAKVALAATFLHGIMFVLPPCLLEMLSSSLIQPAEDSLLVGPAWPFSSGLSRVIISTVSTSFFLTLYFCSQQQLRHFDCMDNLDNQRAKQLYHCCLSANLASHFRPHPPCKFLCTQQKEQQQQRETGTQHFKPKSLRRKFWTWARKCWSLYH